MTDISEQPQYEPLAGSQNAKEDLQPGETPDYPGPVPAFADTHEASTLVGERDGDTGNLVTGVIDTTPTDFDPAASHDGGHTTVPSSSPPAGFEESTPRTSPHTAAAADVLGSGGTAA